jgi:phosphate/sulfate permease
MTHFLKKYRLTFLGVLIGAIAGYAYYYFVGCNSGTCAITSSPINSTIYGVLMGGLLFNMIQTEFSKKTKDGK